MAGKKLDRDSEDYAYNLLVVVQEKLLKLQDQLESQDVPELLRHIADREVHTHPPRPVGTKAGGGGGGGGGRVENQRAD